MSANSSAIGNPAPFGLLCFGMTTMSLMYVEMGWVDDDFLAQVAALAVALGGFGQVLVGIFEILKGSSFSFAVFESYGAFWLTWAIAYIHKANLNSTISDTETSETGMALYLFQWMILSACFWVITWRKNNCLIVIFSLLVITFCLLAVAEAAESETCKNVAGYFGMGTAISAFYTGVAELINEEYGRMVLPGLAARHTPQRVQLTSSSVRSLINYDTRTNTLWLQFRGLQIRSLSDVNAIRDGVLASIDKADANQEQKENKNGPDVATTSSSEEHNHVDTDHSIPSSKKVHVVVDYDHTIIANDIASEYWSMASKLEAKYYLSATRFHVSSFGTRHQKIHPHPSQHGGGSTA